MARFLEVKVSIQSLIDGAKLADIYAQRCGQNDRADNLYLPLSYLLRQNYLTRKEPHCDRCKKYLIRIIENYLNYELLNFHPAI